MANYTYDEENPRDGAHPWIDKLELIDPVSAASSDYVEIHFTKPKAVTVDALTHPHVTFDRGGGSCTRYYMVNAGGNWTWDVKGREAKGQKEIADKVRADALDLNWIRRAPPPKQVDDQGFTTIENKGAKKKRMQTDYL